MIDDFKQFLKFYQMYKKGKSEMEKIKEFISENQKTIIFVASGALIYSLGFRKGFKSAKEGMSHVFEEAARTLPVGR